VSSLRSAEVSQVEITPLRASKKCMCPAPFVMFSWKKKYGASDVEGPVIYESVVSPNLCLKANHHTHRLQSLLLLCIFVSVFKKEPFVFFHHFI